MAHSKKIDKDFHPGKIDSAPGYYDEEFYVEELPDDDTFVLGQFYEDRPAKTLRCKHCHGTEFLVGQGSYYTAISCKSCEWQCMIHDG